MERLDTGVQLMVRMILAKAISSKRRRQRRFYGKDVAIVDISILRRNVFEHIDSVIFGTSALCLSLS
jgi:hypothetical protein